MEPMETSASDIYYILFYIKYIYYFCSLHWFKNVYMALSVFALAGENVRIVRVVIANLFHLGS